MKGMRGIEDSSQTYQAVTKGRLSPALVCGLGEFDVVRVEDGCTYLRSNASKSLRNCDNVRFPWRCWDPGVSFAPSKVVRTWFALRLVGPRQMPEVRKGGRLCG